MLADALDGAPDAAVTATLAGGGAVFVGSGDSLSSAILADAFGHRSMSSGDITFMNRLPVGTETVVGISHSGTSGATVRALRLAREEGRQTIAITSNPSSPLADAADRVQIVPTLALEEIVPCAGHMMLGLGVAAVCGQPTGGATAALAASIRGRVGIAETALAALPAEVPQGISVLSLPDLRGAADFWMLKLIEATGITVRTAALEESGHVDYFIGPDSHLAVQLIGEHGEARHERLGRALETTGQTVLAVRIRPERPDAGSLGGVLLELTGAAIGTAVAEGAAARWGRPPFRGGAVNMDARHIKLDDQPIVS
jgi:hypothetical protein